MLGELVPDVTKTNARLKKYAIRQTSFFQIAGG